MKLLVIGDTQSAHDMVNALRQPTTVSHVRDARELEQTIGGAEGFDWVLVDQSNQCAAEAAAIVTREVLPDTPVSKVSEPRRPSATARKPMPMCAVETTQDGLQILRCALRHAAHNPEADPALTEAIGERPLVFEYHAARPRKVG